MTTFEDARTIVDDAERDRWRLGTYYVAPYGYDTGDEWLVIRGAREFLVDGDPSYAALDQPPALVHKLTGRLRYAEPLDFFEDAAPVNNPDGFVGEGGDKR